MISRGKINVHGNIIIPTNYSPSLLRRPRGIRGCYCLCIHAVLQTSRCILTRDKTFTMLGEVGMANESTKTTQTSVWMAQYNEQTRLHDLSCMSYDAYQPTRALVMPTLSVHCVEPSTHLFSYIFLPPLTL